MSELRPGERIDDLQRSNLKIIQDPAKFCFGMDAVLLSGFVSVKRGGRVTDLCTGSGIIPLLLSAKTEAAEIKGIEIQAEMADMAARSVRLNTLEGKVHIVRGDLRDSAVSGESGSQDVVTCNPPYMRAGEGVVNPDSARAIARHELCGRLEEIVQVSARLLKNGGRACFVYRPNRLIELISAMRGCGLEPKRMKLVHPFAERDANMVLLEAVKGGRCFLTVEPPVIVFQSPGMYSREIREIYGY